MSVFPFTCGVGFRRHIDTSVLVLACIVALLVLSCGAAAAADAPASTENKESAQKPAAPVPVPLSEISVQGEAVAVELRAIEARAKAEDTLGPIEKDLPALSREIDTRARENARILSQRPSLELLGNLERNWVTLRATLAASREEVEARIALRDRDLTRLTELETTWKETLALARREQAPAELIARVESLLVAIARTRSAAEADRARALRLQSRVTAQEFRVSEIIDTIGQSRDATLNRLFQRDGAPLWDREALARAGELIATDSVETRESQRSSLGSYAERRSDRIFLHFGLFLLLAALLYRARRRLTAWAQNEPELQHAVSVVEYPVATALVLALIASRWFYPQAPRLLWAIIGAAALVPTVLILSRLAAPYLRPLLYAVLAFFLIDQVRLVSASIELVPRLTFVGEMIGGAAFLAWFLRKTTPSRSAETPHRHSRLVRTGAMIGCVLFAVTALANAFGYLSLSNLIGNAVLRSMYFGLILYVAVEILDAMIAIALRVRPLTLFGMVRRHRELLRRRVRAALRALAVVLWTLFALDKLAVRERLLEHVHGVLTAELSVGAISISLADVLAFILAVWASFVVSRFVQFVLDEEIFPHARLKRGLPYAISRTVHYTILVAGFFLAMGVIGVDMTKFTILAGAFTVGVGFGLQNIFNNFVSGLILLFERPVQVGDVIQMDDATGVVERIGIRASIVRTAGGSEVIVPNGKLISERLINWTFSDRQRAIEVSVSVVLGSDPAHVIRVLERVAAEHPLVLKQPPPEALLVRLGPDWMGFDLRASTDRVEDWMRVRSELGVAVAAALNAEKIALR